MRAYEFLSEDASAGATASGAVATVAMPLTSNGFGYPGSKKNSKATVIRRPNPYADGKKKKNKNEKKG